MTGDDAQPTLPSSFRLARFAAVDSTSEELRRRAAMGEREGLIVWAGEQLAGRGRRGRAWSSPPGNLYCSLLLRPRLSPAEAARLSFLFGLAVADTIASALPPDAPPVACKWPNDVLIGGAKTAGILLESRTDAAGRLEWLIAGTGINLRSHPPDTPYPATSLVQYGCKTNVVTLLESYAGWLDFWLARWRSEGFISIREAWLARAWGLGQAIRVHLADTTLDGVFESLDDSGALVLRLPDGRRQSIAAGEVFRAA